MISYNGYRVGFPFPLITKDELGDPVGIWDQTTLYDYLPSGDSTQAVKVVGEGVPYYPLGFTLQQFSQLFWRAKTLGIAGDFTSTQDHYAHGIDFSGSVPEIVKIIRTQATPALDDREVAHESELVTPIADNTTTAVLIAQEYQPDAAYPWDATPWVVGTWVDTEDAGLSGSCAAKLYCEVDFSKTILASDGKYYPYLAIRLVIWADNVLAGGGYPTACGFDTSVSDITGPQLTLTICGASCNVSARQQYELGFPADAASGAVTIDPQDFWSYDGPWNTTTGAPA